MLNIIDEALEAEFALRRRHPERDEVYDVHRRRSAALRARGDCQLDVRYGAGPRCRLDIFGRARPAGSASVLFFIHGGYWRALDKSDVSFIAEPFLRCAMTVVMPTYDLAPAVRVGEIVDQVRAALAWVIEHLAPERIVVSGHSAGGQLAAMLALDQAERGSGPIVGLAGISGAFDLRPLLKTSINTDLALSAAEAEAASPLVRLKRLGANTPLVPLVAAVGGEETQGFKQWTADFVASWGAHKAPARLIEVPDCTHFTILDALAEDDGSLAGAIRGLAEG
jgi:arylformamidase